MTEEYCLFKPTSDFIINERTVEEREREIIESGFKWFKREADGYDPMVTIRQIEEHFGLSK